MRIDGEQEVVSIGAATWTRDIVDISVYRFELGTLPSDLRVASFDTTLQLSQPQSLLSVLSSLLTKSLITGFESFSALSLALRR